MARVRGTHAILPAMTLHPVFRMAAAAALFAVAGTASAQLGEEVPFITTPDHVTLEMLRIADVGAKDHVIDLGSGDGRIVITAARQFGATGLGVEIVPDLVEKSRAHARRAARRRGVGRRAIAGAAEPEGG